MTPQELESEADQDTRKGIDITVVLKWEKHAAYFAGQLASRQKQYEFSDEMWRHRIWSFQYFPQLHTEELASALDAVLTTTKELAGSRDDLGEATWLASLSERVAGLMRQRYQGYIDDRIQAGARPPAKRQTRAPGPPGPPPPK